MDKATFLRLLRQGRAELDALLARVDEAHPPPSGISLKDLLAHILWYEREMVGVLRARALAGSEWWDLPLDTRNARIREASRGRTLDEVRAEAAQVFQALLAELEALAEEDLHDASRFAQMPGDWAPWQVIASNCFEHYAQHLPDIRAWLERPGGRPTA